MKIASWNVNSIRARETIVSRWLSRHEPDVICLQETKCSDDDFPIEEFLRLGYEPALFGQKTYNGVALLSRHATSAVTLGLEGDAEAAADRRFIAATVQGLCIASAYVPNGQAVGSAAFQYKLRWLEALRKTLESLASTGAPLVVCGDFNIARDERDVYDPSAFVGQLHFHPDERATLESVLGEEFVDSLRLHDDRPGQYSWWDYRAGKRRHERGLRIDYIFISRSLAPRCLRSTIDQDVRWDLRPSDHAPLLIELSEG